MNNINTTPHRLQAAGSWPKEQHSMSIIEGTAPSGADVIRLHASSKLQAGLVGLEEIRDAVADRLRMLSVLPGDGMSADDAAWASIADAAEAALTLPGLSSECASEMGRVSIAARYAAGCTR